MPGPIGLMQALLGNAASDQDARTALELALEAECDPLRWCAISLGLTDAEIMRRAADWADIAFFEVVPELHQPSLEPGRLEMLADFKMFRCVLLGREVAFAAPDFFGLLRLKKARHDYPVLRDILCLIPGNAFRSFLASAAGPALVDGARQTLTRRWPYAAAQLDLTRSARWLFVLVVLTLVTLLVLAPFGGHLWILPVWAGLIAMPAMLRAAALLLPLPAPIPVHGSIDPAELPLYSIIVPLRDEANMVNQLCIALKRLRYPAHRLEILFLVEQRSFETVEAVRRHLGDVRFILIEVMDAMPRTKPKALGYALPLCRGELVVVFDAEDRPDPDQLLKIVAQFQATPDVACIQARLIISNGARHPLAALFAGEYAALFTVMLPALARWNMLVPLGGTSNHFRLATLRKLGGWDAFNVTEDADLGVRLARCGLTTAISRSWTLEDAPERMDVWVGQRTRWMKGWMRLSIRFELSFKSSYLR